MCCAFLALVLAGPRIFGAFWSHVLTTGVSPFCAFLWDQEACIGLAITVTNGDEVGPAFVGASS